LKEAPPPPVYLLEPAIEQAIALAASTEPKFWASLGYAIDPRRMRNKEAQRILDTVRILVTMTGGGPTSSIVVVQQLNNLSASGSIESAEVRRCRDYLIDAEAVAINTQELIGVVAPIIKRSHYKEVVQKANDSFAKNVPPEQAASEFERVSKIGVVREEDSGRLSSMINDDAVLIKKKDEPTCPIGVTELDQPLGGGLERPALGLLVGGTGSGKSLMLAHVTVEALLAKRDAVYVTLELGKIATTRRIIRNLVGMTQPEITIDPALARSRYSMLQAGGLGQLRVVYMDPLVTSPKDIRTKIIEFCREDPTFNPTVIAVDFMDKVRVNIKTKAYDDQLLVADSLRSIAVERDGWLWTASQGTRQATGKSWLGLDAVADSMNKVRSADLVIGIGRTEDDEIEGMIRFSIPKRREGEGAHTHVGPIPWDPEHGRIAVITRPTPW
jgi:archaellum biogenesis ATPase FlaH